MLPAQLDQFSLSSNKCVFLSEASRHIKQAGGSHSPGRWLRVRGVRGHRAAASSSLVGPIHLGRGHQHSTWWQGRGGGLCGPFIRDSGSPGDKSRKACLLAGQQEPQAQQLRPGAAWLKVNLVQGVCLWGPQPPCRE